jgi:hypothetical protein
MGKLCCSNEAEEEAGFNLLGLLVAAIIALVFMLLAVPLPLPGPPRAGQELLDPTNRFRISFSMCAGELQVLGGGEQSRTGIGSSHHLSIHQ